MTPSTRPPLRTAATAAALFLLAPLSAMAAPLRVATLVPWVGDALASVPNKVEVIASTRRFVHAPPVPGMLDLGDGHAPNLEVLISAGAQVVVADRRWHARFGERVEQAGAEVVWIEADSVEATFAALIEVGRRVGVEAEMTAAVSAANTRLAQLHALGNPRSLALFGAPGSYLVISDRTWIGDLLRRLGYQPVLPAEATERMPGYLAVSDEFLAAAEPDVILLLAHGDPTAVSRAFADDWKRIRRSSPPIVALDPMLFATNPGLRLVEAAESILGGDPAAASGSH